jgi:hypothetical protein
VDGDVAVGVLLLDVSTRTGNTLDDLETGLLFIALDEKIRTASLVGKLNRRAIPRRHCTQDRWRRLAIDGIAGIDKQSQRVAWEPRLDVLEKELDVESRSIAFKLCRDRLHFARGHVGPTDSLSLSAPRLHRVPARAKSTRRRR